MAVMFGAAMATSVRSHMDSLNFALDKTRSPVVHQPLLYTALSLLEIDSHSWPCSRSHALRCGVSWSSLTQTAHRCMVLRLFHPTSARAPSTSYKATNAPSPDGPPNGLTTSKVGSAVRTC